MLDDGVLGLLQYLLKSVAVERIEIGEHRKATYQLGYETERFEVVGLDVLHHVALVNLLVVEYRVETHGMGIKTLGYLTLDAIERSSAYKQDIARINMNIILVGMLAASLWWDINHSALKEFEHGLLNTLSTDITSD